MAVMAPPPRQVACVLTNKGGGTPATGTPNHSRDASTCSANSENDVATVANISGRTFVLEKVIGKGAFGVVWLSNENNVDYAIKHITSTTPKALSQAVFEAELLQDVTATSAGEAFPRYVTHSTTRDASGGGTVLVAMSLLPGCALDMWLYGCSDTEHKTMDASRLVEGILPGGHQRSLRLPSACGFAKDLLTQIAPVFAKLEPLAFHRDVSSHNVLVDMPKGDFALIDFGLAVRSKTWHQEWDKHNLCGDPRYWPPAAWMAFSFGMKSVNANPNLRRQYLQRIDHFGMGVLGLELLFGLWTGSPEECNQAPGMGAARRAWCNYWRLAIRAFQVFHTRPVTEARQHVAGAKNENIACMLSHLAQLREALRAAARQPANASYAVLLAVLADLIDENGKLSWADVLESGGGVPVLRASLQQATGTGTGTTSRGVGRPDAASASLGLIGEPRGWGSHKPGTAGGATAMGACRHVAKLPSSPTFYLPPGSQAAALRSPSFAPRMVGGYNGPWDMRAAQGQNASVCRSGREQNNVVLRHVAKLPCWPPGSQAMAFTRRGTYCCQPGRRVQQVVSMVRP